jgi:hypothetical protein
MTHHVNRMAWICANEPLSVFDTMGIAGSSSLTSPCSSTGSDEARFARSVSTIGGCEGIPR